MPIAMEMVKGVTFIQVPGRQLDASNAESFKAMAMADLTGKSSVVLDLADVEFIDSSGLGILLACLRHVQGSGGDLRLCGLTPQVQMLFELVRMQRVFQIHKTREQAALSFADR